MIKKILSVVFICLCGLISCMLTGCKHQAIEVKYESAANKMMNGSHNREDADTHNNKHANGIIFLGDSENENSDSKIHFGPSEIKFNED